MEEGRGKGSYRLGNLTDPTAELARLRKQAEMFRGLEIRILKECGLKEQDRVLELGCGPGFVSGILAECAPQGALASLDNDPHLLAVRRSALEHPPAEGELVLQGSAISLPVAEGWADFSYARFLLQHVPQPERIIAESYRATAPGGRLCVVDSDDGLIVHHPENDNICSLLQKVEKVQASQGGDRFIGRKLPAMMRAVGFENVRARIVAMTSTEIPFDALFSLLFGYKSSLIGKGAQMHGLLEELTPAVAEGRFLLAGGIFVAVGERPA